ncbi:MAG TPA: TIGR02996 domain-containing protein, partial [Gemmataceae bacterium]|nr:TIGR02996 domain-containing protein [Gemmataceae bacterium]
MNERQHLLRAVIDNPEDDSARLAYSDWLDEHADTEADRARAAFIRLQCAAARLDRYDLRRLDLDGQAEALLEAHGNTWLAGLKNLGINQHYSSFDRGFPEVAMVSVNDLLDRGDELWAVSTFRRLTLWEGWRGDSDESRFP